MPILLKLLAVSFFQLQTNTLTSCARWWASRTVSFQIDWQVATVIALAVRCRYVPIVP